MEAKFILSKKVLKEQVKKLEDLGLKVSYSYKTNREVGRVLQEISDCDFSIHAKEEVKDIGDKRRIWFFLQAESLSEIEELYAKGIRNFVIDNEKDLEVLLRLMESFSNPIPSRPKTPSASSEINEKDSNKSINISLRMKFQEHRIGTGRYFVYGMPSVKINEIIKRIKDLDYVGKVGVHIHRKTQNTSEWDIVSDLNDSLDEESLTRIDVVNLGGGLPSIYRSSNVDVFDYVFGKLNEAKEWLAEKDIETVIEPGRFLAAPCVRLVAEIIQKYDQNLIINTTIYNCAMDSVLTNTKMLIEGELGENEKGEFYLIKGNSPTRDDIFRYRVKLSKDLDVGDKIVFLNAGAYNYTTDFFGFKKLKTEIVEDF